MVYMNLETNLSIKEENYDDNLILCMIFIDKNDELIDMAKVDLNLIVIFDAIMKEQSITAAAEQLAMTQPSVSNAVARMRHNWKDPLFVKQGRGVRATPFAVALWQQVAGPLNLISSAVMPMVFDAKTTQARFRIALTDGMAAVIWPELRKIIESVAPNIDIHAVPYKMDGDALLMNADVDLVFDYFPESSQFANLSQHIRQQAMFENRFVCVMNPQHRLANTALTLEDFVTAEHLLVSLSGDASGVVDSTLANLGQRRRISMTVNSFASGINLIKQSQLISSLPYPIVAEAHLANELVIKSLPISVPPAKITMAWHRRDDHSLGLRWLRDTLSGIIDAKRALLEVVI